jgi:hypothetical protein
MRMEDRSFNLTSITRIVDEEAGAEVEEPWQYFGIEKESYDGDELLFEIDRLTWRFRPAIIALKFFTLSTRGLSKRERSRLIGFVREICFVEKYSDEQLEKWLNQIWCADVYEYRSGNLLEYQSLLDSIPVVTIPSLKIHAMKIAGGSGRKPINPFWAARIESEFSVNPRALQSPASAPNSD